MQYYLILIQCPIPFRVSTMVRFPASKSIHKVWKKPKSNMAFIMVNGFLKSYPKLTHIGKLFS